MLERLEKRAAFCFSRVCVREGNDAGEETVLSQEGVLREPGCMKEANTIAAFAETLLKVYIVPSSSFDVYSLHCSSFLS